MTLENIKFAFWGTGDLALGVLDVLVRHDYTPDLIITSPDKPKGRGLELQPSPVKIFAQKQNIKFVQPATLKDFELEDKDWDLFIVAEYGKIIPESFINMPKNKTLNVHPSLLPKFRGPSPIESFILSGEKETGVTIIILDKEMDHGPILKQENFFVGDKRMSYKELEKKLAEMGGDMLVGLIPAYFNKDVLPKEQNHEQATYCQKITKEMGLVDPAKDDPESIVAKSLAFNPWPGVYYFIEKNDKKIRVILTDVDLVDGKLLIKKVKPEGKNEMSYEDFLRGYGKVAI